MQNEFETKLKKKFIEKTNKHSNALHKILNYHLIERRKKKKIEK